MLILPTNSSFESGRLSSGIGGRLCPEYSETSLRQDISTALHFYENKDAVTRFREVDLSDNIKSLFTVEPEDLIVLNLFSDVEYIAEVQRVEEMMEGNVTITAKILSFDFAFMIIATTDGRTLVTIHIPEQGKQYEITSDAVTLSHYLIEIDPDALPIYEYLPYRIPPDPTVEEVEEIKRIEGQLDNTKSGVWDPATMDVMIVYTPAARTWANTSGGGIRNRVASAVAYGNTALSNSNTVASIRLVHNAEVSYTESGNSDTDLDRLTWTDDGHMDIVHTWRNTYGADLVQLFTTMGGGVAWVLSSTGGQPAYAFSLAGVSTATGHVPIHEMGHNMGCGHHKQQNHQPGPRLYTYSAGWRWQGTDNVWYNSVMSYSDAGFFPLNPVNSTTVAHFSNPSVNFMGVATGHAADGDNARTIRNTKHVIAAYRSTATINCIECPGYDFTITPGNSWATHSSSFAASGCKIYRISVEQGRTFTFKTGCGNGATANFDTFLEIRNNDCTIVASNDDGCEDGRSIVSWMATYTGYAYVRVRGFSGASGTYTMAYQRTSDLTWTGASSTNWNTASNWNGNMVPDNTFDVIIPTGAIRQPSVSSATGSCKTLIVNSGATLTIGGQTLNVAGNVTITGSLAMNNSSGFLNVTGNVVWESGSTANISAEALIYTYGNWNFNSGSNANLTNGTVVFAGSSNSWLRSYSSTSSFNHLSSAKTGSAATNISYLSNQPLTINGQLYVNSGSLLDIQSEYDVIVKGNVNSMGSFICTAGKVVLNGTTQFIRMNTGDYFNNLTFNQTGTVTINILMSNTVKVNGNLQILSGIFSIQDRIVQVGGNWTNNAFPTGFNAGTGRVIFNGSGHQYIYSSETFNILEAAMGAALRITNAGHTVTCNQYKWTSGGIDVIAGTFTALDLADNGLYGGYWVNPGGTINLTNSGTGTWVDLRGSVNILGGTMNITGSVADWPYANGANFTMTGGVLDFKTCGLTIYNSYSWTNNVSGGTIRTSRGFQGNRADFTPTGGTFEFYGSTDFNISQSNSSTLHHVKINKGAKDGGEDHINGPVYDERSGMLLSDGSKANTISLGSNFSITGNLDIDAGTFSVGQYTCDIGGNTNISGTLAMTHASGVINANGNIVWNSGSTANFTAMNVFNVWGHWNFESGSNANLANGVVAFRGSNERYVRSYSATSSFFNISSYKTGGVDFGISSWSTQPLTIGGNIYVDPGAKFGIYSSHNVILKGSVNSNGEFICNYGTVVLNGVNQSLRMNTGNYFNRLTFNQSGTATIDNTLSSLLEVRNHVVIQSGVFNMQNRTMHVGGNWTNNVGTAAFNEGTGRIVFNGTGTQTCNSETFHILEVNKTSGTMNFPGTTVCASYDWTAGGITVNGGTFTANDLADNALWGSYAVTNGTINLHQGTGSGQYIDFAGDFTIGTGGVLNVYGGSLWSYWPFFSDASLTMSGNAILDIKDQGILVANNALSFTTSITGGTIRTSGGFQGNRADFTPTAGTFEFYGSGNSSINQSNGSRLHHVLINKSAKDGGEDTGTGPIYDQRSGELLSDGGKSNTITMSSDFTLTGNININAGTLNASNRKLNVGLNWTNNVGTTGFSEGTSTVEFFGPNQAKINTAETFYNMTVNKTYTAFDGLEIMSVPVTVLNDLDIIDGTLEVNSNSVLTIGNNVSIADGAGLNVGVLDFDIEVYIGGNYTNNNTSYNTVLGYTPGGETITFNGSGDQLISTLAPQEDFGNFRVDKPSGSLRPNGNLQVLGDFEVVSGSFFRQITGLTHSFNGDFTVGANGSYNPGSPSTTVFKGMNDQDYFRSPGGLGIFNSIVVDKTAEKLFIPPTVEGGEKPIASQNDGKSKGMTVNLLSGLVAFNGGTTTIENGTLNLNGNSFKSVGNYNINSGGVLNASPGSSISIVDGLFVNDGGVLELFGTAANNVVVHKDVAGLYQFEVNSGGTIRASHTNFRDMNANGINIKPGAIVDAVHSFHNCTFRNGAPSPSTLLTIDNNQTFTVNHAIFPANTWGGQYNATKNVNQGLVTFYNATGGFAGENFDNDFFNRIDWFEPTLTASPSAQTVTPPAGSTTFNITSNMTWTVAESTAWFSVAPMWGSNNGTITVSYDRNTSSSSRSGTITLSATDCADVILTVTQEGVNLSVNPLVRDVTAAAGTVGFSLNSNAAWTISESVPWFSVAPLSGTGNSFITVNYDENTSLTPRSGQFTVSSTGAPDVIATINQAGVVIPENFLVPSIIVAPGVYECFNASNTITVQYLTILNGGMVNLVAGHSIIMLPGVHAQSGSYLHAWISSVDHCGIITPPALLAVKDEVLYPLEEINAFSNPEHFFRVYPNPTTGLFTLELVEVDETANITVEIYSMLGESLLRTDLPAATHYQFDLSAKQAGVYLIRVRKGEMVGFDKLIKH